MLDNIALLALSGKVTEHASARHSVIAQNIANADTPGFRARDIGTFQKTLEKSPSLDLRSSRDSHFPQTRSSSTDTKPFFTEGPAKPNGNSVSLEQQTAEMVKNRQSFELAVAVYKSSLGILRTSLGRG